MNARQAAVDRYLQADPLGFACRLKAPEFHWFFVQGVKAIENGLIVPGTSSLLNGIEASLRFTISQVKKEDKHGPPSPYRVLSNNLIKDAGELGMPIASLAFPGEANFAAKLETQKPNVQYVEIVRHRNDLCHGNTYAYFNRELGEGNAFFTPECLKDLATKIIAVSDTWATELSNYRRSILR
jgi:hypothetical protein